MSRAQALTIAILAGLVVLVCIGMAMLTVLPFERIFPLSPTTAPSPPSPSPTSTFPSFIPTANLETVTVEPTATNTLVPTATPRPPRTPTPTVIIHLTLPPRKPTATPVVNTPVPIATATSTVTLTPSPAPRGYSISFEAEETKIVRDECTQLRWKVEGASSVILDGESVESTGKKKVCPKYDTSYELKVKLLDGSQFHRTVKIDVEEEEE
ncbi:MAG: hypothetical protein JXM69_15200 [Anaerolineae bacterium]|nr:hypothetical protein [Anaerolineae bacterium]